MSERFFEYDPITGATSWFSYDEMTGRSTIRTEWDIAPYLEQNRRAQNDMDHSKKGEWWHVASIPNAIITKWLTEDGIDVYNRDHEKAVLKKLDDPEWRYLRRGLGNLT